MLGGCGNDPAPVVPELQEISPPRKPYRVGATIDQRFPKFADKARRYRYIPGTRWALQSPSSFRTLNFSFGPNSVGEVYLSEISAFLDDGLENVNRWRGQMGKEPISADELAKVPRKPIAGRESPFIDLEGSFKGMGAVEASEGYRLLGMLYGHRGHYFSIKMTGPSYLIEREKSEFLAFCETIEVMGATGPFIPMKIGPFAFHQPADWEAFLPQQDAEVRRPFGFRIGPKNECVSAFGMVIDANKGGAANIINQWARDLGKPALSEEQIKELPKAVLLEGQGHEFDVETEDGKRFVGIVSLLQAHGHAPITAFATLEGPTKLVAENRVLFSGFCQSLAIGELKAN